MPIYILLSAVDAMKSVYLSSTHERDYTRQPRGFRLISLCFQAGLKFLDSSGPAASELGALASKPSLVTILFFPLWAKKYNETFGETVPIL